MIIGLFRIEEGKTKEKEKETKSFRFRLFRKQFENDSNVTNSRTSRDDFLCCSRLSRQTFSK